MEIAFIANPTAGRGRARSFVSRFAEQAADLDSHIEVLWTRHPGHATELARDAASRCDVVCVSGGDGTVHEAVNGLMPRPVPLVVIPSGSGNDFASLVGCPTTPEELHDTIADGQGVRLDIIDCGSRYCANSVGLGFEAKVTRESLRIRWARGLPLYTMAALRALVSMEYPHLVLTLDEQRFEGPHLLVSIGSGTRAGGGFQLLPDAVPDDGQLDVCMVAPLGRLRVLSLLPRAIGGGHTGEPEVTMARGRSLRVETDRPLHMHVDGEYSGMQSGPLQFTVLEKALPVLCMRQRPTRAGGPIERLL
jgi:YegS/Rv2252/BmrU family lipid kinase